MTVNKQTHFFCSQGEFKTDLLNMSLANKAKAIYSNARQLSAQYNKKRLDVEAHVLPLLYYPYDPFKEKNYQEMILYSEMLLKNEDYENLIQFSKEIMVLSLSGLSYYHNYYQKPLLILVTLSFGGWIACLLKELSEQKINTQVGTLNMQKYNLSRRNARNKLIVNITFSICAFTSCYLVYGKYNEHY